MNVINMKIHKIENNSLIVSFSTDESKHTVDHYAKIAFQPETMDFNNTEGLLREIAKRGIDIARSQVMKEKYDISHFQHLVGQTFSYPLTDINVPVQSQTIRSDRVTDLVNS
jgi:hypothetical protein